jgi:hypothetical protein
LQISREKRERTPVKFSGVILPSQSLFVYQVSGPPPQIQELSAWIRAEFGLEIKLASLTRVIDYEIFSQTEIDSNTLRCIFELPDLPYYSQARQQIDQRLANKN